MEMLNLKLLRILILYEAAILYKYSDDHSQVNAADSCKASRGTVARVGKCPENEAEWMEAAKRKNCSSLAGLCPEPDRFVYHCVLNFFLNETLEVCAYGRRILLGRCTEYSILGNLIQESRVDCKMFLRPCPVIYPSTEAYKYQGCYNLVQRPTTSQPLTTRHLFLSTTGLHFIGKEATEGIPSTTSSGDSFTSDNITERSGSEDSVPCCGIAEVVVIVVSLILSLTIFVAFLVVYLWRKRQKRKYSHKQNGHALIQGEIIQK
ncbi:uncharacterized protein LOC133200467 [Saccostrea echinata]|uniref:uncharacterized protein LOC133200467 n=1 Tax=Saccostrea echinata TaxID=191078 RepID=UPI002A833C27|nr:uncharacterized protein LOC133200467 [Saccostrea echinata]